MKRVLLSLLVALAAVTGARASASATETFRGRVYQVDTIYNNIDVFVPGGKKTFWADAATKIRVHRRPAQLIDIAMGDEVRGTYATGPRGARVLVMIEDVTGE